MFLFEVPRSFKGGNDRFSNFIRCSLLPVFFLLLYCHRWKTKRILSLVSSRVGLPRKKNLIVKSLSLPPDRAKRLGPERITRARRYVVTNRHEMAFSLATPKTNYGRHRIRFFFSLRVPRLFHHQHRLIVHFKQLFSFSSFSLPPPLFFYVCTTLSSEPWGIIARL